MPNTKSDLTSLSRPGMAMLMISAMEIALCLIYLIRPIAISGTVKFAILAALGGSIVLLFRFTIPGVLRIIFAVLLIALMISIAVRADILGLNSVSEAVDNATKQDDGADGSLTDKAEPGLASSRDRDSIARPVVRLLAADSGDGGWAERINAAAAGDPGFGGMAGVVVRGFVALRPAAPGKHLQIIWMVEARGKSVPCGMLSVAADENALAIVQLVDTFRLAAQRSSESADARCN
jgi:hypothetical protein